MKITNMLNEDLGNLAQLNVGPMINVLKQQAYNSRRHGSEIGEIGSKFKVSGIGNTSEIKDLGVLKQGLKTLRKAFKDNEGAKAFAVYIGGRAVMFGLTDEYQLAGSSRESAIAYDLSPWQEFIDKAYDRSYSRPSATTARTEPVSRWSGEGKPRQYAGKLIDTGSLGALFTLLQTISKDTNQPLTAKLVMMDVAGIKKHRDRLTAREISTGAKDLRTRLAIYKNSKKPTVNSVKEFIAMSLKNPGSKVQFAGTTYNLRSSSYDKIEPSNLLAGMAFSVHYSSADPGVYDSLNIVYKFDTETNQLLPIHASFRDRTDPNNKYKQQEEVLDARLYLIHHLKTRKLGEKDVVLPKILTMVKSQKNTEAETMMKGLEHLGYEWPEFAAIRKSINAQKQQS